jgi:hypothetical protein
MCIKRVNKVYRAFRDMQDWLNKRRVPGKVENRSVSLTEYHWWESDVGPNWFVSPNDEMEFCNTPNGFLKTVDS